MQQLMYISTATVILPEDILKEMLISYRRSNEQHGITGLLLYSGDHYVQLLEGEATAIYQLFGNILKDFRHNNIIKLADGAISQRLFSDWSMGFKVVSAEVFAGIRGYVNPSELDLLDSESARDEAAAIAIMRQFVHHNLADVSYL